MMGWDGESDWRSVIIERRVLVRAVVDAREVREVVRDWGVVKLEQIEEEIVWRRESLLEEGGWVV